MEAAIARAGRWEACSPGSACALGFGIPNLVIEDVPATTATSMADVINATADTMVRDGRLKEAGKLAITADIVGVKTLAGAVGKATLHLVEGSKEDGDPEGPLVEIAFPGPASSVHERQGKLIDTLFGSEDAVTHVEHDEALRAASAGAKKELMKLKPRFSKGQTDSVETLEVKAPFETSSGGTEWMWVEVTAWEGSTIHGILQNDPFQVPGLEAGAKVEVAEDSIFDYIHTNPDGSVDGNTTAKLLERQGR